MNEWNDWMKWMNESGLILSAFENRLRAGLVYNTPQTDDAPLTDMICWSLLSGLRSVSKMFIHYISKLHCWYNGRLVLVEVDCEDLLLSNETMQLQPQTSIIAGARCVTPLIANLSPENNGWYKWHVSGVTARDVSLNKWLTRLTG